MTKQQQQIKDCIEKLKTIPGKEDNDIRHRLYYAIGYMDKFKDIRELLEVIAEGGK